MQNLYLLSRQNFEACGKTQKYDPKPNPSVETSLEIT